MAINQMAPGKWQKKHCYGGNAWLYALGKERGQLSARTVRHIFDTLRSEGSSYGSLPFL
jgi:hypothetical protein